MYGLLIAGLLCAFGAAPTFAQFRLFTQNREDIKIDTAGFPADIQKGYQVFRVKCNECHNLDTSLKPSMSSAQWAFEVKRMQNMPSSHFNDVEAKSILNFLNYDELHRKSLNKPSATTSAGPVSAGRQFYDAQGCESCHAIGGNGGSSGPSLSDVGKRLSRDQISQTIQTIRTGKSSSMPPLPADTSDQQIKDLIDFLATLKDN
jgi:mono/diheme cytochrome c family protein